MIVTITTLLRAKASPSWRFSAPEPAWKPPPWIHTITGKRSSAFCAGDQMLRFRQSSLLLVKTMSPKIWPCAQRDPNSFA